MVNGSVFSKNEQSAGKWKRNRGGGKSRRNEELQRVFHFPVSISRKIVIQWLSILFRALLQHHFFLKVVKPIRAQVAWTERFFETPTFGRYKNNCFSFLSVLHSCFLRISMKIKFSQKSSSIAQCSEVTLSIFIDLHYFSIFFSCCKRMTCFLNTNKQINRKRREKNSCFKI